MKNRKRDTDVQNRLLDFVGEGEGGMFRENSIETGILSIMKQITSPGWMHETSARAWCTGKTQRDWVEREVGGGSGRGIHVNPWLIHVNVWQNPLQYCKVISLQLIKINNKKKENHIPQVIFCFPGGAVVKNPSVNIGDSRDRGLIPGSGRSSGGGFSNPLQNSCLENSTDTGAWWDTFHGLQRDEHNSTHALRVKSPSSLFAAFKTQTKKATFCCLR